MAGRVKEFFEVPDLSSLDELIGSLLELRERLPANAVPEMKLRTDDVFGGTLRISYFRERTPEETSLYRRYEVGSSSSGHRWIVV